MTTQYEAWRISFQSSEQAARSAWHSWQQESINYALEQDDFLKYQKEAEALHVKLIAALKYADSIIKVHVDDPTAADPIIDDAVSAYNDWKKGHE